MIVRELIEQLQKCPQDAKVIAVNKVREGELIPEVTEVLVNVDGNVVKIRTHNYPEVTELLPSIEGIDA